MLCSALITNPESVNTCYSMLLAQLLRPGRQSGQVPPAEHALSAADSLLDVFKRTLAERPELLDSLLPQLLNTGAELMNTVDETSASALGEKLQELGRLLHDG